MVVEKKYKAMIYRRNMRQYEMASGNWHDYFDEDPEEEIGRYVKGFSEEDLLVVLPRISWAYADWMEKELKADMVGLFMTVDTLRTPDHGTRTNAFQNVIYKNYLECEKAGLPRPPWCAPATQEDFDQFEAEFSIKIEPITSKYS